MGDAFAMSDIRSLDVLSRDTLDSLPIAVAILDEDGTIVVTNEAWRQFGGETDLVQGDSVGVDYLAAILEGEDEHVGRRQRRFYRGLR